MTILTFNQNDTVDFGIKYSKTLKVGDVVCLEGGLGAGKTTFAKGVAKGLGFDGNVTSPTFNIVNEYTLGDFRLVHIDAYRLEGIDYTEIGLEDLIGAKDCICLVEWSQYIEDLILQCDTKRVSIKYVDDNSRKIEF